MPFQVWFGLFVSAFLAVAWYVRHEQERRRSAELAAYCAFRGWGFTPDDPGDLVSRWEGPPFDAGSHRQVRNVVTAKVDGREVVAFEYTYVVRQGKSSRTFEYLVVTTPMPCPLPGLHVAPESVFDRLGTWLGGEDIDLESEDFNRQFRVRCPHAKFAHDVLTPRTMEALLATGGVEFRFEGADALCYLPGRFDPVDMLASLRVLGTVLDGIPSFVWRDRGVVA